MNNDIGRNRSISFENQAYFKPQAKAEYLQINKFMDFYINIEGYLNPINFMNLLCDEIVKQLEKYDCYIEEDKNNKLEFELYFDKYEKDEEEEEKEEKEEEEEEKSEENILSMQINLYETPKGFLLRFLRKKNR